MRIAAVTLLALALGLTGCMTLHADLPPEVIRQHIAHEEGVELAAICSQEGKSYSEGAVACMAGQRMACDAQGRWIQQGGGC